jgi:hypothetical protein
MVSISLTDGTYWRVDGGDLVLANESASVVRILEPDAKHIMANLRGRSTDASVSTSAYDTIRSLFAAGLVRASGSEIAADDFDTRRLDSLG